MLISYIKLDHTNKYGIHTCKYSEMIGMHTLHRYVLIESDDAFESSAVHKVLFGGDQLTAARARGCRDLCLNSETITGQLQDSG